MNKKGSVLIVTLVLFMMMLNSIGIYMNYLTLQTNNYKQLQIMMKEKNMEILLIKYYIQTERDDILFSDTFENDEVFVDYVVTINEYEEVLTTVCFKKEEIEYQFELAFDEDYVLKWCHYL